MFRHLVRNTASRTLAGAWVETSRGFTLIEIMIAVALFSVGLAGIAAMQLMAIGVNNRSNVNTQLMTVAQQAVEKLLTVPVGEGALRDDTPEGTRTTYIVYVPSAQSPIPNPPACSTALCVASEPSSYRYKVQWDVDIRSRDSFLGIVDGSPGGISLSTVDVTVTQHTREHDVLREKTFRTSFAKSNLGG